MSIYPIPSICAQDQITDWFESLAECLHWNVRKKQKQLDEYSDLAHSSSSDTIDSIDSRNEHLDAWRKGTRNFIFLLYLLLKICTILDIYINEWNCHKNRNKQDIST